MSRSVRPQPPALLGEGEADVDVLVVFEQLGDRREGLNLLPEALNQLDELRGGEDQLQLRAAQIGAARDGPQRNLARRDLQRQFVRRGVEGVAARKLVRPQLAVKVPSPAKSNEQAPSRMPTSS